METLKHPACTIGWVVQLCCSWLSPGKATRISHGRNPIGTVVKKKKSKSNHVCFAACSQILDVERMLAKSATPAEILAMETHQQQMENHPVIRTLYDHAEVRATLLSAHCLTRQKLEPSSYPHKLWPCSSENCLVILTLYDHAEVRATVLSAHCLTRQKLEPSSYPHKLWPCRGENCLVICTLYDHAEVRAT